MRVSRLPAETNERLWRENRAMLRRERGRRRVKSTSEILVDRLVQSAAVGAIVFAGFAIARVFNVV